jgi:ElaB/YqjD/DUF883 family membrane-anchored ribosome-binding protein
MNPTNKPPMGTTGNGHSSLGAAAGSESHTEAARAKLGETGDHLKHAAQLAGNTARSAAEVARSELRSGGRAIGDELSEAARSGAALAGEAREVAGEQFDAAMDRGRAFVHSAEELIRERPLAALGVAVLAGLLIARIGRD